ncbi:diguanylate cyclase [Hahella sp. KA22]|uniref:diguanylate cyclase n=1 Tax=Hahella sp. KA22 TaxID=1628392 RepID=UPI0013E40448|nr:diguanylate cyclase [Hahella sp. KA22]
MGDERENAKDDSRSPMEKMQALRTAYASALPQKLTNVRDSWSSVRTLQNFNREILMPFRHLVHRLAGSGASYGFARLSALMQKIEQKIDQLSDFPENAKRLVLEIDNLLTQVDSSAQPDEQSNEELSLISSQRIQRPAAPKALLALSSKSVCNSLPEQLKHYGYEVRACPAEEVIENALRFEPDIVVYEEPSESQVCPAPIEMGKTKVPFVFVLHQTPNLFLRVQAYRAGIREVLQSPPDISQLLSKFDQCFISEGDVPYRVLLIDDDSELAMYHAQLLEQAQMNARVVSQPEDIPEVLLEFFPDVILMDLYLPGYNGIELAVAIRQDATLYGVPIIFVSVEQDIARHLGAIRAGGDDFLIKPVPAPFLLASVESRARRGRELRGMLSRDGLTGLLNHVSAEEYLSQQLSRARRMDSSLAYVMVDLDHFKKVNDNYGHLMGDRVLVNFARYLQGRLRRSDVIGRYGGEEFVVILPDTTKEHARFVIESMRMSFASINHNTAEDPLRVTFSAGIAAFPDIDDMTTLTKAADDALYDAKQQGRNKVCIYKPKTSD